MGWVGLLAVGLCLGLLGAGGTAIALPVLVYAMGLSPHEAVAASLAIVGGSSAVGTLLHARKGTVRWKAALAFAPFGMLGSALGARGSHLLSGRALLLSFSALLLVIGVRVWRDAMPPAHSQDKLRWGPIALAAGAIGTLTGLLGVGGGFVIVPALAWFGGLGVREAMATSLAVITANCAVAFAGHAAQQHLPGRSLLLMLAVTAVGMILGVELAHRTRTGPLRKMFAALLILLAAWMAYRNL